jgi:PAS domain S-box-containing protein
VLAERSIYMKRFYQVPHFWGILTIMYIGALVYYADQLPIYRNIITLLPLELARYSTYRILSIIPVAYAAFVFGLRGGVITAIFISLALLPRALFFSPQVSEAVTETMAFLLIGLLVSLLIQRQQLAFHQLENAQQELRSDVQIIKYERKRLAALNQILSIVSASLDLDRILNNAIDSVVDVMQVDVAWIFLLDEKTSELILTTQRGISEEFVQRKDRIKLGEGFNGKVAETGETLFVEDASKDPRLTREVISDYNICSSLIVPLRCKAKICGTLCTAMYSHRWFRPEEVELLTAIGGEIGIAVENAHLYQKQQAIAQQLQLSEERYRGVFESASEAIFVYSASGRIISANRACEQLTGYTQDELLATTVYELFSEVGADKLGQLFAGELERVVIGEAGELRLARKDGTEAFIQLKISPLMRDNQIIGLQAIARDVTEERRLRQNMEYYVTQITRAQEDERLRISRELHDDTAQVLAGLSRELNSLLAKEGEHTKSTKESLEKLNRMADSALEEVHRFSQDLRPSILDDLGLVPALEWLTTQLEKAFGLATKFSITGNQHRLPPENELTVFRIAQEALSNVKRHSQAIAVEMGMDFGDEALTLVVSDNGQGFKMPQRTSDLVLSGSLGIIGMRERARLVGGTLIVQSELGIGTTVTLRMPG